MREIMARKLNIIIYKDGDTFIASGVEVDVFAHGKTKEEAARRLEIVLSSEIEEARRTGRDIFDLGPAPDDIQALFHRGNSIVATDYKMVA